MKYKCGGCGEIHDDNDFDPKVDIALNTLPPKFRGIKEITLYEVVVAEGNGTNEDPVREVHYFCDKTGKIKFVEDSK